MKELEFQCSHKGKCCTCEKNKELDTMVRKYGVKGTYECVDCLIDKEYSHYSKPLKMSEVPDYEVDKQPTLLQKAKVMILG